MTAATHPAPGPSGRGGLPVLGPLSPIGRLALIITVVASVAAIVLDFGLHANANLIFIVAAAAILGAGLAVSFFEFVGPPIESS